jgi:hypothetical protein
MSKSKPECKLDASVSLLGRKNIDQQSSIIKFPLTRLNTAPLDHTRTFDASEMDVKKISDLLMKHRQVVTRLNFIAINATACMASINGNCASLGQAYNHLRVKEAEIFDELRHKLAVLELPNGNISFYFQHFQQQQQKRKPEASATTTAAVPPVSTLLEEGSDLMELYMALESALQETEFGKGQDASSSKYFSLASDLRVADHDFFAFLPARYITANQPLPLLVACQDVTMRIGGMSGAAFDENVFTYCEALMEDLFPPEETSGVAAAAAGDAKE